MPPHFSEVIQIRLCLDFSPQQQSDAVGSWYKNRGAELFHSEIPNHTAAPVSLNSNGIPLSPAPASVPSISSSKRDVWQTAEIASGGTSFKLVLFAETQF